jgi:hypothetical protein
VARDTAARRYQQDAEMLPEFSKDRRSDGTPWMPGTRLGMTISFDFNSFASWPGFTRP